MKMSISRALYADLFIGEFGRIQSDYKIQTWTNPPDFDEFVNLGYSTVIWFSDHYHL
jgi:hypothetical protein